MINLNSVKKKIAKEHLKVSIANPSKLLAEFFNGVVFQIDEECRYES